MNDRYEHLLRKSHDAKRGGHDAWAVQSTGEKLAVALVLNRADWLEEMQYTIAEAIEAQRAGMGCDDSAGCPPACRGGVMAMQTTTSHRSYQVSGIIAAILLALLLLGTASGRGMRSRGSTSTPRTQ